MATDLDVLVERLQRLSIEGKMTVAIVLLQRNELELAETVVRMAANDLASRRLLGLAPAGDKT